MTTPDRPHRIVLVPRGPAGEEPGPRIRRYTLARMRVAEARGQSERFPQLHRMHD